MKIEMMERWCFRRENGQAGIETNSKWAQRQSVECLLASSRQLDSVLRGGQNN